MVERSRQRRRTDGEWASLFTAHLDGASPEAIAKRTGVSLKWARVKLKRLREQGRQRLARDLSAKLESELVRAHAQLQAGDPDKALKTARAADAIAKARKTLEGRMPNRSDPDPKYEDMDDEAVSKELERRLDRLAAALDKKRMAAKHRTGAAPKPSD